MTREFGIRPLPELPEHLEDPAEICIQNPGFGEDAFRLLGRLQQRPTVSEYQRLKDELDVAVVTPFKEYRDDLVVNLVLPNRLPLETEKNVFSRFPKNDFGAGGAHSHLWFSFYRLGEKRLTDIQIVHSLSADSFTLGLYLHRRMSRPWRNFRRLVDQDFDRLVHCFGKIVYEPGLVLSAADDPDLSCRTPDEVALVLDGL
ncbi:MAG: hypothetical protein KJO98_06170, partial [Rhodothermia bacterium]|nr:hypothetical protein [Rhodothermia bacterium]